MEDCEWVLVKEPTDRDIWSPSLKNGEESSSSRPLEIRFNEAAKHWTDALPIGNGRLGAMIWGGVSSEILNLNGKLQFSLVMHVPFICKYGYLGFTRKK